MATCKLCGKTVTKVYEHHYPVPQKLGGTEIIAVCPRCHQIDHQKVRRLISEIEGGDIQPDLAGDDPHADRRAAIRAALERRRRQRRLVP